MKIKVPANLLLFGEYFITQEDGLGLSFAVDSFFELDYEPYHIWDIKSTYDGFSYFDSSDSFFKIYNFFLEKYSPDKTLSPFKLVFNSSAFFENGKKLGLGSSATYVIAIGKFLYNQYNDFLIGKSILNFCLDLYYFYQKKIGSGYDIATSLSAGFSFLKKNKDYIEVKKINNLLKDFHTYIYSPNQEVSSVSATKVFYEFIKKNPENYAQLFEVNNNLVLELMNNFNLKNLEKIKEFNIQLGKLIGVSSEFDIQNDMSIPLYSKALGAGNETILLLYDKEINFQKNQNIKKINIL